MAVAYNKKKLFKQAKDIVAKNASIVFIEDVVVLMRCAKSTFYLHFPNGSDELEAIKDLLELNKVTMKTNMRKKWYLSDNAVLQVSLMKLIGTDEEVKKLSMNHNDHTTKGEKIEGGTNAVTVQVGYGKKDDAD